MTSTVRVSPPITNTTGDLIPSGNAAILLNQGQDYAVEIISRTIINAEIGANAGQTRDAAGTVLGVNGFLFAQFQGALIKRVLSLEILRPRGGAGMLGNAFTQIVGTANNTVKLTWWTYSLNGLNSLYILDEAAGAPGQIVAADIVRAMVLLGNS